MVVDCLFSVLVGGGKETVFITMGLLFACSEEGMIMRSLWAFLFITL